MHLFWRHGFAGTSVRNLCDAMGIKPGSFYSAFHSKEDCFRLALQRYLAQDQLSVAPSEEAIRAWMEAITRPDRSPRGCLLVNSAIEHDGLDPGNQALVSASLRAMGDFFWLCLRHRPHARADAALLSSAVAGIHVMARAGTPPAQLRVVANRALEAVNIDPIDS